MWFLFGKVFSSSGCLGWATLIYCGTPWAFHIIILSSCLIRKLVLKTINSNDFFNTMFASVLQQQLCFKVQAAGFPRILKAKEKLYFGKMIL